MDRSQEAFKNIVDEQNKFKRTLEIEKESGQTKKVTINILKGKEGYSTGMKLLKVIIPLLGGIADGAKHDDFIHGVPKTWTDLSVLLIDQMDKIGVEALTFKLLDGFAVNGVKQDFDEYFAGNYAELIEILEFALKENFGSLFMGKGIKARLITALQKFMEGM